MVLKYGNSQRKIRLMVIFRQSKRTMSRESSSFEKIHLRIAR
jgi:hypothetical protein